MLRCVLFVFYGSDSVDVCTYICLMLNTQVFILELVGLLLGLMLSLHINIFRVRIYVRKVHGINLSCVFMLAVLYSA